MTVELEDTAHDLVRTAARAFERDRYLAALLAPRPARNGLLALAAFAGELTRIAPMVSEPMIGRIRLQWWRDAVASDTTTGNPIADALNYVRSAHAIAPSALIAVIDAREQDFSPDPPADDAALFAHLDRTEGALFALAAKVSAMDLDPRLVIAAGRSYGLARLLLELPAVHAQGRTLVPRSRLAAADITFGQLLAGEPAPDMIALAAGLSQLARDQLANLRVSLATTSRKQMAALLPVALVEPYLKVVERRRGGVGRIVSDVSPLRRVWTLWTANWAGRL